MVGMASKVSTKTHWDKYVYTAIMLLNHAAFGMTRHMFFSVMVDLKIILNTSMNNISLFNTFVSIGYLLGSLFGLLYKYVNRQITVSILLTLMSTASALIPYSETLTHIYVCGLAIGLGSGCWNGMANVWLIEIWQKRSAPFLQLIQFMFGIGTILSPLVNQLFLKDEDSPNAAPILNTTFVNISTESLVTIDERRESLKTSFLINGLIQITFPVLLVIMFVVKKYEIPEQILLDEMDFEDKKYEHKKNLFKSGGESRRTLLIILFAILFMFYNACEGLVFQFGPSYFQNIGLRLTASKAAGMMSVMATAYTIGRGLNVLIAIKVRAKHLIEYHLCIVIVGFIALFFAQHSRPVLTLANVVLGFGFSAIFPAILAYLKQYIDITDKIGTILMFSSETVVSFTPYILGTFIENQFDSGGSLGRIMSSDMKTVCERPKFLVTKITLVVLYLLAICVSVLDLRYFTPRYNSILFLPDIATIAVFYIAFAVFVVNIIAIFVGNTVVLVITTSLTSVLLIVVPAMIIEVVPCLLTYLILLLIIIVSIVHIVKIQSNGCSNIERVFSGTSHTTHTTNEWPENTVTRIAF